MANDYLARLGSALVDFHKAAVNIAAIKVKSRGGVEPESLQQLFINYFFLKLIAVSGYLPVTFTMLNLYVLEQTSWYLIILSCTTIAFAIGAIAGLDNFEPSEAEIQRLSAIALEQIPNSEKKEPPKACQSRQPWTFCLSRLDTSEDHSSGRSRSYAKIIDEEAWTILAFCLVVLAFLILSKIRKDIRSHEKVCEAYPLYQTLLTLYNYKNRVQTVAIHPITETFTRPFKALSKHVAKMFASIQKGQYYPK